MYVHPLFQYSNLFRPIMGQPLFKFLRPTMININLAASGLSKWGPDARRSTITCQGLKKWSKTYQGGKKVVPPQKWRCCTQIYQYWRTGWTGHMTRWTGHMTKVDGKWATIDPLNGDFPLTCYSLFTNVTWLNVRAPWWKIALYVISS